MRQRFDQQAENIGLTSAKWTLIAVVARHPGATQRIIADMLEITEVTAGRLIDRLCADGYLRRTPHLSDRRAYCVEVTEAARPLLERLSEIGASCESELFAGFSAADVSQLETLLDAALGNLSDIKRRAQENASENAADSAEPAINASLPAEPAK
jgi:DNA-binding MarR family transcriptional regulator